MKTNTYLSTLGLLISLAGLFISFLVKDEIVSQLYAGLSVLALLLSCQQMQKS